MRSGNLSIRSILAVQRRHPLMPALVFLQVALACAILCNVLFMVWQRLQPMLAPSGIAGNELVLVDWIVSSQRAWTAAEVRAGSEALRQVPGVRAVSAAFGLPMESSSMVDIALQGPTGVKLGANAYFGEGLLGTLGLELTAGRDFSPGEYRDFGVNVDNGSWHSAAPQPIIVTEAMARRLFGAGAALGGVLTDPNEPQGTGYQVVGIVRHLLRNQLGLATDGRADDTVLLPKRIGKTSLLSYALRVDPARQGAALRRIRSVIDGRFGTLMRRPSPVQIATYAERRAQALKEYRAALWLFASVTVAVVLVTAAGIMGLTGFWVQRRTRQIGILRALGARRGDVLRQFLLENLLIVGAAIFVGMSLAYLGNALLMRYYELPHLPWNYLPVGAALMLAIGQLAVLGPALRAAAVPPVVATRAA